MAPIICVAQLADTSMWQVNGSVAAIKRVEDKIYVAGKFNSIGLPCGSGVSVNITDGSRLTGALPKVNGKIFASISDGAGGWYIGGRFNKIGSVTLKGIARLNPDLTLNTTFSQVKLGENDFGVGAFALYGNTLYIGGDFNSVGGLPRNGIAALDAGTGAVLPWKPELDNIYTSSVHALAIVQNKLFIGGNFKSINGIERGNIAAFQLPSGILSDWTPPSGSGPGEVHSMAFSDENLYIGGWGISSYNINTGIINNRLNVSLSFEEGDNPFKCVAISGNTLFVGGSFKNVNGQPRNNIAAVNASTGELLGWNPGTDGHVESMCLFDDKLFFGGVFTNAGGVERFCAAATNVTTGQMLDWNPAPGDDVITISATPGGVYIGGSFHSTGSIGRNSLAAIVANTGMPLNWNPVSFTAVKDTLPYWESPMFYNIYNSLEVSGNSVYVTGNFTHLGNERRNHAGAFDATTGQPTSWNPSPDSTLSGLVAAGNLVYAAGAFRNIGGQARNGIAALDAETGIATDWNPAPDKNYITSMAISGNTIYVSGAFTNIGGQSRKAVAALNVLTGLATPWHYDSAEVAYSIKPANGKIYIIGNNFQQYPDPYFKNENYYRGFIAATDTSGTAQTFWTNSFQGRRSIAFSADMLFTAGTIGEFNYYRNNLSRAKTDNGVANWGLTTDSTLNVVSVYGDELYLGGAGLNILGRQTGGFAKIKISEITANMGQVYNSGQVIYPNPTTGRFIITSESRSGQPEVFNLLGQKLKTPIEYFSGAWQADISSFACGIYLVKTGKEVHKIVKD
ncbi:MAG: PQQ-binding-like beta-propeller repeat protein [Bacteroidota bacterium]